MSRPISGHEAANEYAALRRARQDERDRVIGAALQEAENHKEDRERGGCTCGFCAWSVDHVLIMSMREALQ